MDTIIVSLSGGVSSAVAAERVIEKYGINNIVLVFCDTLWEDEDLYRFLADLEKRWDSKIVTLTDGRTPLEVGSDFNVIPGQKVPICSKILKQTQFKNYLKSFLPVKPKLAFGLDWTEMHRISSVLNAYPTYDCIFPLLWEPLGLNYFSIVEQWGIEIPRLYKQGFSHNNCGGRCVRQGKKEWLRLLKYYPNRYKEVEEWENAQNSDRKILQEQKNNKKYYISLTELRLKESSDETEDQLEDRYGCFCAY